MDGELGQKGSQVAAALTVSGAYLVNSGENHPELHDPKPTAGT